MSQAKANKRFVLRRVHPRPWLERMYGQNSDLFDPATLGKLVEVEVSPQREEQLRNWVQNHGDDFEVVFRPDNRLGKEYRPVGIRVRPGETKELQAADLHEELSAGVIDLESASIRDGKLHLTGRVPRVLPDSGLLGKMGRYDIHFVFNDALDFKTQDPGHRRAIPVTISHHDPADKILHLGMPDVGYLEAGVGQSTCSATMSAQPAQIRRWMRWHNAS